jgi:DNA-binding XRE family transcriptional regulator
MGFMVYMNYAERIKRYRVWTLRMTQAQFAQAVGVSTRSVINWEQGGPISDLSLARLESAFPDIFSAQGGDHLAAAFC